ncbi:MAG: tRNA (adenosine(37)-N6)-dimethylallyltransferase MiaA [Bacteroidetes bacterium]|nr:tRNA (adenosine(37)-N6)-dimethylallyltransferase MiaA [Bacteroidota bacterium]
MKSNKYLIVIGGPTASGKTAAAIKLAQHFETEIVSADSRQVFREMTIGTAVPDPEELRAAPHHLIQTRSVQEDYSVGAYVREALPILDQIFEKNDYAVLAGGSGLYIKGVCEGLDDFPKVPESLRTELRQKFEIEGLEWLQKAVQETDPKYFAQVDQQNPVRLLRALEVSKASGKAYSTFRQGQKADRPFTPVYMRLEIERTRLYERINRRVDLMLEKGLLEEVRQLFPLRHLTALQTVGYQEFFEFLEGKINLETAIELVKRNSRRYAKRQRTWFRRKADYKPFAPSDIDSMIRYIKESTA